MKTHNHPLTTTLALLALAALTSTRPASAQHIQISPSNSVLLGDPLHIVLTGFPPGAEVELKAQRVVPEFTGGRRLYAAQARFKADAEGRVDVSRQAPLSGTYSGADVRGLFWSMAPVPGAAASAADEPNSRVTLQAALLTADPAQPAVAVNQTLTLLPALPGVISRPAEPFAGAVFAHLPGDAKRPALIVLGGSEGGAMITRDAPIYASRGYAVLALPYYSPPGWGPSGPTPAALPSLPAAFADIPVERLQQARDWLAQQPQVDASRIGVMGTSKGAEFALLAAAQMPWIKSVVAMVPSDVVWEGWGDGVASGQRASFAWKGQPYAFVPYQDFDKEFAGFATGADVKVRRPQDKGRAAHPGRVPAARIRVEDIKAPVMVVGAHDDQVWDSGSMAQNIQATRNKAGLDTLALVYPDAGHYLGGNGFGPTTQYNAGPMKSGGTPAANARAQADAFGQVLSFLQRTLGPVSP
jgi:dienelactone hydrolase